MTKSEAIQEVLTLPPEERLALSERLWTSVAADAEHRDLPLHRWQEEILDDRLAAAESDPDGWSSWEEARARLLEALREGAADRAETSAGG